MILDKFKNLNCNISDWLYVILKFNILSFIIILFSYAFQTNACQLSTFFKIITYKVK